MSRSHPLLEMEPVYGVCHAIIRWVFGTAFRGEISGLDHLPAQSGYIVASNHASHLDPPIVGAFLTRQVSFFARKSLWKPGFPTWWLNKVGTIPVDRDGGADIAAIKRVIQALESGKVVILFPEGTRSPDGRLQPAKGGVGMIACKTHMPVVPARIFGSYDALGKGGRLNLATPVDVTYGRPLLPEDYDRPEDGRERYQRAADRIMAAIAALEPSRTTVI
jgi:1-acyl-sn-glycerol-3-phosphate acyltransferase